MQNSYESGRLLAEYLFFHYGKPADYLPWKFGPHDALDYPRRCITTGFDLSRLPPDGRGLDVGCAVGRSTLEMTRHLGTVLGVDFSASFIGAARELAARGSLEFDYTLEGARTARATARLPEGVNPGRVSFEQGDAMELRPDLGSFDAVLAANLVCRLPQPRRFLKRCAELVRPGGQLVITTPFTWMEEYTAPGEWLGAHPESGESLGALREELEPGFELEWTGDLPFLIREHRRKYQWSVAQACRFVRRLDQ